MSKKVSAKKAKSLKDLVIVDIDYNDEEYYLATEFANGTGGFGREFQTDLVETEGSTLIDKVDKKETSDRKEL